MGNRMDRGAWLATIYGVAKSQTWLSDWAATESLWKKEKEQQWSAQDSTEKGSEKEVGKTIAKYHLFFFF